MCHLNQTLKRILLCVLTHGSRNMSPTFWSDLQSLFGFLSPDRQTWWTCFLAGCYQPSYEVMLRFYSLYKQAVCGPCTVARPSFWDPVGRYKWYVCVHVLVYHCNQSLVSFQVQIHQLISCFLFLLNVVFFFFSLTIFKMISFGLKALKLWFGAADNPVNLHTVSPASERPLGSWWRSATWVLYYELWHGYMQA